MSTGGELTLGQRVKELRERTRINQKQLADYLEIDQSYVSKFESDERSFGITQLEMICELFGCSFEDLFKDKPIVPTLSFSFRTTGILPEDLCSIAKVNKIAMNILEMQRLSEG